MRAVLGRNHSGGPPKTYWGALLSFTLVKCPYVGTPRLRDWRPTPESQTHAGALSTPSSPAHAGGDTTSF